MRKRVMAAEIVRLGQVGQKWKEKAEWYKSHLQRLDADLTALQDRSAGVDVMAAWDLMPGLEEHVPQEQYRALAAALGYEIDHTVMISFGTTAAERRAQRG